MLDARNDPSNHTMPSYSAWPSTNKLSSASAVKCPGVASAPTRTPEVTEISLDAVTAPVRVDAPSTVNTPETVTAVPIDVAQTDIPTASVAPITTADAMAKGFLIRNFFCIIIVFINRTE